MKTTIWTEDDYLKLAPINDELIKKAEDALNVKLPENIPWKFIAQMLFAAAYYE